MTNLPEDFILQTRQLMGEDRFNRYLGAFEEEAPTSIRLNPRSGIKNEGLIINNYDYQVPWCPEGYYLQGRPQFTFDPLFHAGCYYVQEASSMFITHILNHQLSTIHSQLTLLDLCAAPGGKSTAAISVLPEGSTMVSNEPIANRAQILLENITKWGYPNCIVTNNYPRDFRKSKAKFDIIICDVPCSGEGMFRKDPATIGEWSMQNVEKCWRLQREIVADAWECLNPGGILIYSTCTFNTKENEENVRWIIDEYDAEAIDIPTEPEWNITGSLLEGFDAPVYRFIPGITKGEGLFICALRKSGKGTVESGQWRVDSGQWRVDSGQWRVDSGKWRVDSGQWKVESYDNHASDRSNHNYPLSTLNSQLRVLTPDLPDGNHPHCDLPYSEALKYLRGEAIVLPADAPRGIVTVTYKDIPLGPVKNIGNRANNLYPKPWRIKTTHLPSEPPKILEQIMK